MEERKYNSDPPGTAAWRVIEPYWNSVSIYDGSAAFHQQFAELPQVAKHLFAVRWCDHEVCNGGYHQFFSNSTGILAPEAIEGFRAAGLDDLAELTETAIAKFPKPYPRERAIRHEALEALKRRGAKRIERDPFGDLDSRYYAARDRAKFEQKIDDFASGETV